MKLILFDIDGTLIRSHSAGRTAMTHALKEVFGTAGPIDSYRMSGKTDPRIITDLLAAAGIDATEIEAKLSLVYERMTLEARDIFPGKDITPCPGVPALLSALEKREDVVLGIVTGNIASIAPLKLKTAGLDPRLFKVGAYGSDAADRNQLPLVAMNRAKELTKFPFVGNNTVVIGDTPADILCARAGNAKAIAVASGWHSASTLEKYRPDHLFDNLSNTESVLEVLLNDPVM